MKKVIALTISMLILAHSQQLGINSAINSMNESINETYSLINLYAPKYPPLPEIYIENQTIALMQTGTNINDLNRTNGYTALHMAVTNLDISYNLISLLMNYGALVYAQTLQAETALTLAARNDRSSDIINLLLTMGIANGSDPMHIEKNGNTALNYMLYNLKRHQLNGNQADYNKTYNSIIYLINDLSRNWNYSGTKINVQKSFIINGYYGPNTPSNTLSWLAYIGDINLLNLFVSFFGNALLLPSYINQKINDKTAYDWAKNNEKMLQLLRSYGGKKGIYNPRGKTPILESREIWGPFYQSGQ